MLLHNLISFLISDSFRLFSIHATTPNKMPEDQITLRNLLFKQGSMLVDLGEYKKAIFTYDKLIEINTNDHIAWLYRGIILHNNEKKYEEALLTDGHISIQAKFYVEQ